MLGELALSGDAPLMAFPIRGKPFGALGAWHRDDLRDCGQRHVETPQHHDQSRGRELILAIAAIAVLGIDVGGNEKAQPIVEAERLHRQTRSPREHAYW